MLIDEKLFYCIQSFRKNTDIDQVNLEIKTINSTQMENKLLKRKINLNICLTALRHIVIQFQQ